MSRKLTKALREQKRATQQVPQEIYGTLMAINGFVEVQDRPSFVYVQLRDNQNEIIQAFNNKVASSPDLPVIVHREGNRYIIQGVNTQRYQSNWNNYSPYLPKHGTSHSFADGGGGDVAWIFSRQFMPNLVYPNDGGTTGTSAYIAPHILLNNAGVWTYTGATGTQNLLNYKGTGSSSAMLLIYLDANTGNPGILVGSGSYFPNTLTGTATIYPYIPVPNQATQIPLAAVRMDTGTAHITWDNLYDVRQWIHAIPSGTSSSVVGGGGNGFAGLSKGIPLGTGTMLNVDGSRLTFGISGTMFHLSNSPDPQELIGIYGMSGTVGLGTGTSISFSRGILVSITGTTLYAQADFGLGTTQVASGDRGVTNGDGHDHVGGDGAPITEFAMNLADLTLLNSSTSAHGFLPKLSGNAYEYMNGTGSWSVLTGTDGWVIKTDTWTRTGNHTFTVAGDVTTIYRVGTKVRFKDGAVSYDYGVIKSSVFGGGTTTITLMPNTDYTMANATITNTALSYIDRPEGFPLEFNFTPVFTNLATGTAILQARAQVLGGLQYFRVDIRFTASTNISGSVTMVSPMLTGDIAGALIRDPIGIATYIDASPAGTNLGNVVISTDNTILLQAVNAAGTFATVVGISATAPFTWANDDELSFFGLCAYQ